MIISHAYKKDECNLFYVHSCIQFFVSIYNDTTTIKNNGFWIKGSKYYYFKLIGLFYGLGGDKF